MRKSKHSCLIIDACIARSAGGEGATHATSILCTNFLHLVLNICHKIVMTDEIKVEWKEHQSPFARIWLTQMVARKKVVWIQTAIDDHLMQCVESIARSEKKKSALKKDLLLLHAAMATDEIIVSLDDRVRALFLLLPKKYTKILKIMWMNPKEESKETMDHWLTNGAKTVKKWQFVSMKDLEE